jgi:hypothetical protein
MDPEVPEAEPSAGPATADNLDRPTLTHQIEPRKCFEEGYLGFLGPFLGLRLSGTGVYVGALRRPAVRQQQAGRRGALRPAIRRCMAGPLEPLQVARSPPLTIRSVASTLQACPSSGLIYNFTSSSIDRSPTLHGPCLICFCSP